MTRAHPTVFKKAQHKMHFADSNFRALCGRSDAVLFASLPEKATCADCRAVLAHRANEKAPAANGEAGVNGPTCDRQENDQGTVDASAMSDTALSGQTVGNG